MASVDVQIHGYRKGHQLLASSVELAREDQSTLDRLSDVAGPLRPGERFAPYLSGYELPSGRHYVLARTWRDPTVERAGCVRTLSLLIPTNTWSTYEDLGPFLEALDPSNFPDIADAFARTLSPTSPTAELPLVPEFGLGELLEALFLEEPGPVAVFDAPVAEAVTVRLLTSMWPALRRRFAVSTFARSPRSIGGRSFDLVFAPKDARPKFTDWPGRRVGGGNGHVARHRWTAAIVRRVFEEPRPRLLSVQEMELVETDGAGSTAALRIALLWDELIDKTGRTPTAALGLLDIANLRGHWSEETTSALDGAIGVAAQEAVKAFPPAKAWDFISAMVRKIHGRPLASGRSKLGEAAAQLAASEPERAITVIGDIPAGDAMLILLPNVAAGIACAAPERLTDVLVSAEPEPLGRLLTASDVLLRKSARLPALIERLGTVLPRLDQEVSSTLRDRLLPILVEDWQFPAAAYLISMLDGEALVIEARRLLERNGSAPTMFAPSIGNRARVLGVLPSLRETLLSFPSSAERDAFLTETLEPLPEDAAWLLNERRLDQHNIVAWVVAMLSEADRAQLRGLFADADLRKRILAEVPDQDIGLWTRIVLEAELPLDINLAIVLRILPDLEIGVSTGLVAENLDKALGKRFGGDEITTISRLLGVLGSYLDPGRVAREGLGGWLSSDIVGRNIMACNQAPPITRRRFLDDIEELGTALGGRQVLDLQAAAAQACAELLLDAAEIASSAAMRAAGRLLPSLMRAGGNPVSSLVAAAFPLVYRELAKEDDVPDLFKFLSFVDWDRCKTARRELVAAFLGSSWSPIDLALTACRCGDVDRIMKRAAQSPGGRVYIDRIKADLDNLPEHCRSAVERYIASVGR